MSVFSFTWKWDNYLLFLFAQVTNTLFCRSGPRQVFFSSLLLAPGTGPGRLHPFYSCFSTVDLENIFMRSHTLFVKKVAVKRWFWYIVAAKASFYKTARQFFTSASTLRFCADLDFVSAPQNLAAYLCMPSYSGRYLNYVCPFKIFAFTWVGVSQLQK